MGIRRTKHAVFDLKYHLVWIPKYRKHILVGEVAQYTKRSTSANSRRIWVLGGHDGSNGRPCARIPGSISEIFACSGCADYEEYMGTGGISKVSTTQEAALGR